MNPIDFNNLPITPLMIYRMHVSAHYQTLADRVSLAIKIKYWWNGTHPDLIDDELGDVIDGQFFGPMWMKEPVYKVTDALDRMGGRKRRRWADRWMSSGKRPPNIWLSPIDAPDEPDFDRWMNILSDDDFDL